MCGLYMRNFIEWCDTCFASLLCDIRLHEILSIKASFKICCYESKVNRVLELGSYFHLKCCCFVIICCFCQSIYFTIINESKSNKTFPLSTLIYWCFSKKETFIGKILHFLFVVILTNLCFLLFEFWATKRLIIFSCFLMLYYFNCSNITSLIITSFFMIITGNITN